MKEALTSKRPVVALESTIISHGMPYPRNLSVAKEIEATIRKYGAVPATIAILKGVVKIGLNDEDLHTLAIGNHTQEIPSPIENTSTSPSTEEKQQQNIKPTQSSVRKASTRDIAHVCAVGGNAATTVASTMHLANLAGIVIYI